MAMPSPFLAVHPQVAAPAPLADGLRACLTCQLPLSARAGFCRRCGTAQPQVA
jgi:hypothetical protein